MLPRRSNFLFFLLLCLSNMSFAQGLDGYFDALRSGREASFPYELVRGDFDGNTLLNELQRYERDTSDAVLKGLAFGYYLIGNRTSDASISQRAVTALTNQLNANNPTIAVRASDYLTAFDPSAFNQASKQAIEAALTQRSGDMLLLPKLAARLEMTTAINAIRQIKNQTTNGKVRWKANIALSRLGDAQATEFVTRRTKRMPVGDAFVHEVVPDLIFTRQKEAVDFLITLINSNERLCLPADPDQTQPVNCAYRMMELLAPAIVDFPILMTESGDLDVADYPETLSTVRQWFTANPNYQLAP